MNESERAPAPFDAGAERAAVAAELAGSQALEDMTAQIDVGDMTTILGFGAAAALEVRTAADRALEAVRRPGHWDPGALTEDMARLMATLNDDGARTRPGLLERLRGEARESLDREAERWARLGGEVDRLYVRLRAWEADLRRENRALEDLAQANIRAFRALERYAVAGEQGCRELREHLALRRARPANDADEYDDRTLEHALAALERRVYDLRLSEAAALQAVPMLRMVILNNDRLAGKLDAAFRVALPAYKRALDDAVRAKRRRLQSEAMAAVRCKGAQAAAPQPAADSLDRARQALLEALREALRLRDEGEAKKKEWR